VLYFSGAILLLIFARLMHSGILSPSLGSLGIIILAVSKTLKFKAGTIISGLFIFVMVLFNVWHWVDNFFYALLTSKITTDTLLFMSGLFEGLALAILAWIYHILLKSVHIRIGQKWFVKKSYIIISKLIFFVQLFLVLLWTFAFLIQKTQPLTQLNTQDSTMIAGAIALLVSGIPAIIYLSKNSPEESKRHRNSHHHHHSRNGPPKNNDETF